MLKALKNISKSLLITIIAIICLPILILIILLILQSCNNKTSYSSYEKKMVVAAQKYFKKEGYTSDSESINEIVTLNTLVSEGYIKSPEKLLKDSSCDGNVSVRKNGENEELGLKGKINYEVYLKCDKYNTNTLFNSIMGDLTSSGSGLYEDGDYYVFRGDSVDNYIKFYGRNYRIMGADKDGNVKLIDINKESNSKAWDNKYNVDAGFSYGKTIYKDSLILKMLLKDYANNKKISPEARAHIIEHDVCVGKRDRKDYSISYELDCSEILNSQVVSLVNVSDFARASIDPDCNSIVSKSCRNYNYLKNILNSSWTLNSITNSTYEAYHLSSGIARISNASEYVSYNMVIYIDGNELVKSGNGTEISPYVVG